VTELVYHCEKNAVNGSGGRGYWAAWVKAASARVYEGHRRFITPFWLAKDVARFDSVNQGMFDRPFTRGADHGPKLFPANKIDRSTKGNIETFRSDLARFGGRPAEIRPADVLSMHGQPVPPGSKGDSGK
jgi:hypothetical protein